ncbi:MAG: glycoside hydrolase family 95 protein [Bacteroidaceae bacterium]|nr:glycoside hydrolase family 95 protein [Bacteroidaceae bacterium]
MKHFLFSTALLAASMPSIYAQQTLCLHENRPADYFEESFVLGNGNLGAIVYGGVQQDKISLNDITLWTGEPEREVTTPDAWKAIADIRNYLDQENYKEADLAQKRCQGHYSDNYQPLGQLNITHIGKNAETPAMGYLRTLDISRAVSHIEYIQDGVKYERDYFVSAPDSAIIIRLKADKKASLDLRVGLECQLPGLIKTDDGQTLTNEGFAAYQSFPNYYWQKKQKFFYDPNRGIHFKTVVKAIPVDGEVCGSEDGKALEVHNCTEVLLIVSNVTSFNGSDKDPVKEGRDYRQLVDKRIARASGKSYDQLLKAHTTDYQTYFNRVTLDLGSTDASIAALPTSEQLKQYGDNHQKNPDLEELYFQYGRYLLISSSRTPEVPANLQGLWNESMLPPWSSNYTSNINLEENYWAAETTNLPEMHQSMLGFVQKLPISGGQTAKYYYGVNQGWCLGQNTDIWAITNPVGEKVGDPSWANWTMGGAWASTHIWEHYSFTKDKDFLRKAYPALKGAADFCLNWFIEKNGELITSPCTSPENMYKTPDGFSSGTLYGGTADLAMARECLLDTRKAAAELGLDAEYIKQIDKTLARLHPYKIGKQGNLQEWYHDWEDLDPQHRHQSHLFGLYPGHQILDNALSKGNPSREALLKACAKTLEIKGDNTTGWSTGWRVNLYARLKDSTHAYGIYRRLLKYISPDNYQGDDARRGGGTYPNLLDAHSPFQIDGNFGGCAGVAEMLVQSTMDEIQLLPALPKEWSDGQVSGLVARGGFVLDMTWKNGRVTALTVTARTGGTTTILINGSKKKVNLKKGETKIVI